MKNLTKEEIKKAEQTAFNYIYSIYNRRNWNTIRLDMRYRVSKLAKKIIIENQLTDKQKQEIALKRKERALNKPANYVNYLQNPLVIDFLKNKTSVRKVHSDRIDFHGRNHWAKNKTDVKVLSVIKKMFYKS